MTYADYHVFKELTEICAEHLDMSECELKEAKRAAVILEWARGQCKKFEDRQLRQKEFRKMMERVRDD